VRDFPEHAKDWTRSRCDFDVAAKDWPDMWEPLTKGRHRLAGQWMMFRKNIDAARWFTR
jgi:hypothetical protein